VPVFYQVFQAIAVKRHHAGFGTGKESGKDDQQQEYAEQYAKRYVVQEGLRP
jgi:hypothetical protein